MIDLLIQIRYECILTKAIVRWLKQLNKKQLLFSSKVQKSNLAISLNRSNSKSLQSVSTRTRHRWYYASNQSSNQMLFSSQTQFSYQFQKAQIRHFCDQFHFVRRRRYYWSINQVICSSQININISWWRFLSIITNVRRRLRNDLIQVLHLKH